jgi:hypothetical protein
VSFSISENMPKPFSDQDPAMVAIIRHAWERLITPPMNRAASASAISCAQPSKSSATGGRRISRAVSSVQGRSWALLSPKRAPWRRGAGH